MHINNFFGYTRHRGRVGSALVGSLFAVMSTVGWGLEADQFQTEEPLFEMDLEGLMDLSISSLSKREEKASKAAASVYVLTAKDIERAPVTNIIEALRLIPGVNVSRINSHTSQVSIRGFNNTYAWNLLVLVDGRSIYSPFYQGVFWEQNQIPLGLIERIEVVRGPGGAIWGSNAINGVINIITKSSALEQGAKITAFGGEDDYSLDVKYGGVVSDDPVSKGTWRAYVNYQHVDPWNPSVDTSSDLTRLGLRWDGVLPSDTEWAVMFDNYQTDAHQVQRIFKDDVGTVQLIDVDIQGYVINSQINSPSSSAGEWSGQFYAEYYERDLLPQTKSEQWISDLSYQYRFGWMLGPLTLGVGYRGYSDDYKTTETVYLNPSSEYNYFYSVFWQQQVALSASMQLTLGSKFEDHRFQGGFNQPTVRYAWQVTDDATFWTSYSVAKQAAGRIQRGLHMRMVYDPNYDPAQYGAPPGLPILPAVHEINGEVGELVESRMAAWEIGFRTLLTRNLYLDFSTYYQEYDDIYLIPPLDVDIVNGQYLVTQTFGETGEAWAKGADLTLDLFHEAMSWRFSLSYFELDLATKGYDFDLALGPEKADPLWQATLEHHWALADQWHLSTFIRHVEEAPFFDFFREVEAYTTVDLKLAYDFSSELKLYLVGKNLTDPEHYEGRITGGSPRAEEEVQRSWLLGMQLSY